MTFNSIYLLLIIYCTAQSYTKGEEYSLYGKVQTLFTKKSEVLWRKSYQDYAGRQKKLSFKTAIDNSTIINYLIYLPEDYNNEPNKEYPLILFLHGGGESGNNIQKLKQIGPPKLIEQGHSFPFIIASPQLPYNFASRWRPDLVDEVYEEIIKQFRIDKSRFYLTGASLGGAGTWTYAVTFPDKVAAIAPICGWGNSSQACDMKDVPTWAFHGEKDKVIDIVASSHMVNALKKCGASPKFTIYPDVGHDAWTKAYSDPNLYQWLISQKKNKETIIPSIDEKEEDSKSKRINHEIEAKKSKENITTLMLSTLSSLPASLTEASGIIAINEESFWVHNDSRNAPVLFNIDSKGKIIQIKRISNATNFDWEDLTYDKDGNFYIGDFGNNQNKRQSMQIYKIPNPENIAEERIQAETISFTLSDQTQFPPERVNWNFDIEAMVSFNNNLYLFSKNNTYPYSGYCKMYRLPNVPGEHIAELVDSVHLGESYFESSITSASLSEDLKHLVLLSYNRLFVFSCFENDSFFSGHSSVFRFSSTTQKEGLSFLGNEFLYMVDESFQGQGGNLYTLNLTLRSSCP